LLRCRHGIDFSDSEKAIPGVVLPLKIVPNHACCEPSGLGWGTNRQSRTGAAAMGSVPPPNARHDRARDSFPPRSDMKHSDMKHLDLEALRAENQQLRDLVVRLSEIVVRNVLDRKGPPGADLS
jgi:hypothetical protein